MTAVQMSIIILCSGVVGWLMAQVLLYFLFTSNQKKLGVIPVIKNSWATRAGQAFQHEFESSGIIDEKISDPSLLEKMKPEIEKHVDFFLNEKLATVFPLLYKFMGEKTLAQFKAAFMTEIDLLFPLIIKQYLAALKKNVRIDHIIAERINAIPIETFRNLVYENAGKKIFYFKCMFILAGLVIGLANIVVAHLF